jgi:hypothetical protein
MNELLHGIKWRRPWLDTDAPAPMAVFFADEEMSEARVNAAALRASAHLTPGLAATGFRSGARSRRCRIGRNGAAGEPRAGFPIDDRGCRTDGRGHLARRQVRDPHAGPETAAQTNRGAVIVMVLMLIMRRAWHVLVLMRARLAGHERRRHRVRGGRARQKGQRASSSRNLVASLRMPQKLVQPPGLDKVRFTTKASIENWNGAVVYCWSKY